MEIKRKYFLHNRLIIFIELFGLLLLLAFTALFYLNQGLIDYFFNSDTLLLPSLFNDLFLHPSHYKDWSISPAPHFFPDIFLYAIIFLITKNVYFQFLIHLYLQLFLLYIAVKFVYRHFFDKKQSVTFSFAAVALIYLLAMLRKMPFVNSLVPTAHMGEFIMGIFLLGVQLKNMDEENRIIINKEWVILTMALSFLAGLSDLLFVPQFAAAFLLSYVLFFIKGSIKFKSTLYNGFFPFFASLVGAYLTKYVVPTNLLFNYLGQPAVKKITLTTLHHQFSLLITMFHADMHGFFSLGYILFFIFVFFVIAACLGGVKTTLVSKKLFFLSIFIFFSASLSIAAVFFLAGEKHIAQKYMYPIYFMPLLFFFCLPGMTIQFLRMGKLLSGLAILLILLLLWNMLLLVNKPGFKLKYEYYPAFMACIDDSLKKYGRYGIAEYWDANQITMLSKANVQVVPVHPKNFNIFPWMLNLKKFSNSYSFAVVSEKPTWYQTLEQHTVEAFNGKPIKTIICTNNKKLLIYDEGQLKIPFFKEVGDHFSWPAATLPSQFARELNDTMRMVNASQGTGYVTFGPYIKLPKGNYQVDIVYFSDAPSTEKIGSWDSFLVKKPMILAAGALLGTGGKIKTLKVTFVVPEPLSNNRFEVRTFFFGKYNLGIKSIAIIKDA
jgi:hypothetical protein